MSETITVGIDYIRGLQAEADDGREAKDLLCSLPAWGVYGWREAAASVRAKLLENSTQIVGLLNSQGCVLQALGELRRECVARRDELRRRHGHYPGGVPQYEVDELKRLEAAIDAATKAVEAML